MSDQPATLTITVAIPADDDHLLDYGEWLLEDAID